MSIHRVKGQIRLPIRLANIVITQNCFVIPALRHSVILGMDFFTNHKVSLHTGDKIMTIDHNGITKIPLISNDAGCARVAQTTKIPASSVKNVRIRVSNTRANSCALLQPINLLKRYNVLLPHCLINNANPTSQITLSKRCDNVTFSLLQRNNFTF